MKRLLTTVFAVAAVALAAGTVDAKEWKKVRLGVEGAYPPFSYVDPDGRLAGFDIEIAQALCDQMRVECPMVQQDWDGIIPALLARKYDAIIASMSITEERKKRVDFTQKYYNTPAFFVGAKGSGIDVSPEGLAGKVVGTQRGTTHQCFLEKIYPDAELRLYGTQEEVFLDLGAGRIDLSFSDSIQAEEGFLNTDSGKDFELAGPEQFDLECHGEGAGIAVRKGEDELRESLNMAIKAIREDGTYNAINDKYFKFDVYGAEPGA